MVNVWVNKLYFCKQFWLFYDSLHFLEYFYIEYHLLTDMFTLSIDLQNDGKPRISVV